MASETNTGIGSEHERFESARLDGDEIDRLTAEVAKLQAQLAIAEKVVEAVLEARDAANALDDAIEARWPDECESAHERKEAAGLRLDTAIAVYKEASDEND